MSQRTFNQVLRQIDQAAGTYAKNHNPNAFLANLSRIASTVPFGNSRLFPTWSVDTAIYSPFVRGSGVVMVQQLKNDFVHYVQTSIASGSLVVR
jgi:hypothetical protein